MEIKFRGKNINGANVYGLLTKKKIRSSGELSWAIATGNCTAGETVPVDEKTIAQLVGYDSDDNEIYEGDELIDADGHEWTAVILPKAEMDCGGVYEGLYGKEKFKLKGQI